MNEINSESMNIASSNVITLYHGSIFSFDEIDLTRGKPFKDFGRGFYTTQNREHAIKLATRNRRIESSRLEIKKIQKEIRIWLYSYEFPISEFDVLSVKRFDEPTRDWIQFVALNRRSKFRQHSYDIVTGPTANDSTLAAINGYWGGLYGDVGSDHAIDTLLNVILPYKLPPQYLFATQTALRQLKLVKREEIL